MIDRLIPKFDPEDPHSAVENMKLLAEKSSAEYLAFMHDDVEFLGVCDDQWWEEQGWKVVDFFESHPKCGMIGFGGALGLGTDELYKRPYKLQQLARIDFISNMTDAEAHGRRVLVPTQVAVLDGFCQIIRHTAYEEVGGWKAVLDMGISFHCYDLAMACLLAEKGWEVWMLPISCTHHGGRTSTSAAYDSWLRSKGINGDLEIHQEAHKVIYTRFRNSLPLHIRS
jgi:GT2 family glycosyltransferase